MPPLKLHISAPFLALALGCLSLCHRAAALPPPDSPATPAAVSGPGPSAPEAPAPSSSSLPEAPLPSAQAASSDADAANNPDHTHPPQTRRILGIIPNFRSVNADVELPPQSARDKFKTALQDSFDYSAFVFVAVQAGANMASASTPEFRQGAAGYARYYWHTFADQADENLLVEGILPSALHQDNRYYTLGHGRAIHRVEYSLTRIFITRNDDGNNTFNASEVVGAGAAAGISSLYYPVEERTWTKVGQRWLTNIILDGATFGIKEFWPDLNNAVFHQKD